MKSWRRSDENSGSYDISRSQHTEDPFVSPGQSESRSDPDDHDLVLSRDSLDDTFTNVTDLTSQWTASSGAKDIDLAPVMEKHTQDIKELKKDIHDIRKGLGNLKKLFENQMLEKLEGAREKYFKKREYANYWRWQNLMEKNYDNISVIETGQVLPEEEQLISLSGIFTNSNYNSQLSFIQSDMKSWRRSDENEGSYDISRSQNTEDPFVSPGQSESRSDPDDHDLVLSRDSLDDIFTNVTDLTSQWTASSGAKDIAIAPFKEKHTQDNKELKKDIHDIRKGLGNLKKLYENQMLEELERAREKYFKKREYANYWRWQNLMEKNYDNISVIETGQVLPEEEQLISHSGIFTNSNYNSQLSFIQSDMKSWRRSDENEGSYDISRSQHTEDPFVSPGQSESRSDPDDHDLVLSRDSLDDIFTNVTDLTSQWTASSGAKDIAIAPVMEKHTQDIKELKKDIHDIRKGLGNLKKLFKNQMLEELERASLSEVDPDMNEPPEQNQDKYQKEKKGVHEESKSEMKTREIAQCKNYKSKQKKKTDRKESDNSLPALLEVEGDISDFSEHNDENKHAKDIYDDNGKQEVDTDMNEPPEQHQDKYQKEKKAVHEESKSEMKTREIAQCKNYKSKQKKKTDRKESDNSLPALLEVEGDISDFSEHNEENKHAKDIYDDNGKQEVDTDMNEPPEQNQDKYQKEKKAVHEESKSEMKTREIAQCKNYKSKQKKKTDRKESDNSLPALLEVEGDISDFSEHNEENKHAKDIYDDNGKQEVDTDMNEPPEQNQDKYQKEKKAVHEESKSEMKTREIAQCKNYKSKQKKKTDRKESDNSLPALLEVEGDISDFSEHNEENKHAKDIYDDNGKQEVDTDMNEPPEQNQDKYQKEKKAVHEESKSEMKTREIAQCKNYKSKQKKKTDRKKSDNSLPALLEVEGDISDFSEHNEENKHAKDIYDDNGKQEVDTDMNEPPEQNQDKYQKEKKAVHEESKSEMKTREIAQCKNYKSKQKKKTDSKESNNSLPALPEVTGDISDFSEHNQENKHAKKGGHGSWFKKLFTSCGMKKKSTYDADIKED